MSKLLNGLLMAGALFLSAGLSAAEKTEWLEDFKTAKEEAAKKKIPILMNFTGSDWCPWCIRLDDEVFSTKEFRDYIKDNLILFKADFPQKRELKSSVVRQNAELAEKYNVEGFPTIVLVDSEGKEIGKTGYRPGGPKPYIEHLKEMLKKSMEVPKTKKVVTGK